MSLKYDGLTILEAPEIKRFTSPPPGRPQTRWLRDLLDFSSMRCEGISYFSSSARLIARRHSEVKSMKAMGLDQYSGPLDPLSAATGMQAARLNALDLIESSKLLRDANKHAHSAALSVLAIEECGKIPIILQIFLGNPDTGALWKGFRKHVFKGKFHNPGILATAKSFFPQLDKETLATIANGPPPEFLDGMKQLAWYSECFQASDGPTWHLPKNMDWAEKADMLLAEAKALALNTRDRSPEELEIWKKHFDQLKAKTPDAVHKMMAGLRDELVQRNFIKKEWWDGLLKDIEDLQVQEPHCQPPAER